ncbi:MAG: UpxY family transcription antiterminator [Deltaproteobacteria bacterium]
MSNLAALAEDTQRNWYAVYTVARHEKSVNEALIKRDIETFLPTIEALSQWKDRKKRVHFPLFPGYLFVNIPIEQRWGVLGAKGVVRILGAMGAPAPIPASQIEAIRKLIGNKLEYDPYPYLTEGKEVFVIRGPLMGVRGRIISRKGIYRLVLSVDIIRRSASVEMDISNVEPA